MTLAADIRRQLTLPAICAPMTAVSGPDLVVEACKAGVMAGLPTQNAGPREAFEAWLTDIEERLKRWKDSHPGARVGPLAVNISSNKSDEDKVLDLAVCARHGVKHIITAMGNPAEIARRGARTSRMPSRAKPMPMTLIVCMAQAFFGCGLSEIASQAATRMRIAVALRLKPSAKSSRSCGVAIITA